MCAGAIIHSRLGLLVYGADDPKTGAIRSVTNLPDSYCSNHRLQVLAGIKEHLVVNSYRPGLVVEDQTKVWNRHLAMICRSIRYLWTKILIIHLLEV